MCIQLADNKYFISIIIFAFYTLETMKISEYGEMPGAKAAIVMGLLVRIKKIILLNWLSALSFL